MAMNPVKRLWTFEEEADVRARHSIIGLNLSAELRQALRKSNLQVYPSDICIKMSKTKYLYPDLSVAPVTALFREKHHPMIKNPLLVAEVISPETEWDDKGEKADYYLGLSSLKAYLILEQNRAHATLYTRHEAGWLRREFKGMDAVVPLEAIGCNLALSEAYLNIDFEAGEE